MKSISVTDLKAKVPELSHLRMIDFINPQNDALIAPYLKVLGFDLDYPIEYIPSQHRNLQGQVVIAYRIVGEVDINSNFLASSYATPEDRIIAAGYKDMSLANEMSRSLSTSKDFQGAVEAFPQEQANPDEQAILDQIEVLEGLIDQVRPGRFTEGGSLKTIAEYHAPLVVPVKKERRKRKVTAFSCASEVAGDDVCKQHCGDSDRCLASTTKVAI
jgi:hypothetical protein